MDPGCSTAAKCSNHQDRRQPSTPSTADWPANRTLMSSQPVVRDEEVVPDPCQMLRGTTGNAGHHVGVR